MSETDEPQAESGQAERCRQETLPEAPTIEDLKASIGKGPRLDSNEIANTYYSDEEFLAALEARRNEIPPP